MLIGLWDSIAIGTNSPCDESPAYLATLLDAANSRRIFRVGVGSDARHAKPVGCVLSFGSMNIRSLSLSKLNSLLLELNDHPVDVMLLCETWHDADSVAIRRLRAEGYFVVERARPRTQVSE